MTNVMHTPGPWSWQYTDENGECFVIAKNIGGLVGAALPWPTEIDERDFRRVIANASLIAAAPELLDALKSAAAAIGDWSRPTGANGMTSASLDHPLMKAQRAAYDAIAKAEGGAA